MARSPSDATRFTSTGPYAASISPNGFTSNNSTFGSASTIGSQLDFGSAPPGEQPQQKIARLRAAAQSARQGKESAFDRTVRVGRVWADRAHRFTAIGLIGLTVVSGAVATAGITDMLMHNRRRRNEWLAEQQAKTAHDVAIARQAIAAGNVTEDQMLLINRERAADEAAIAKQNRPGVFKRATSYLFSGLSSEEQKGGLLGAAAAKASEGAQKVQDTVHDAAQEVQETFQQAVPGQQHDRNMLEVATSKLDPQRRQVEKFEEVIKPFGGPLDRQAANAANALTGSSSKSWIDWVTGR